MTLIIHNLKNQPKNDEFNQIVQPLNHFKPFSELDKNIHVYVCGIRYKEHSKKNEKTIE